MNTIQLRHALLSKYSEDDANFPQMAMDEINDYFDNMKPSTSKIDPDRLGSRSVFASLLKKDILKTIDPLEYLGADAKEFNKMDIFEQMRFQAQSIESRENKWVHSLEIVPANLHDLKPSAAEHSSLTKLRTTVDNGKLREDMVEVEGDRTLKLLTEPLANLETKRHFIAAALLLVTGRRTIEVLQTGDFYLAKDGDQNGYKCMFSGQAKRKNKKDIPYEIPLLAPYWAVKRAFTHMREMYQAEGLSQADVNSAFSTGINTRVKKLINLRPHELRAVYAAMTYKLNSEGFYGWKKMSPIGFISQVLGHEDVKASTFYQRLKVIDFTGPVEMEQAPVFQIVEEEDNDGWEVTGKVDQKRLVDIKEMMEKRIRITASSVRVHAGGSMVAIHRFINKNSNRIVEYNESLIKDSE